MSGRLHLHMLFENCNISGSNSLSIRQANSNFKLNFNPKKVLQKNRLQEENYLKIALMKSLKKSSQQQTRESTYS